MCLIDQIIMKDGVKELHCNSIIMNAVLGKKNIQIMISGSRKWTVGEKLKIVGYTVERNEPTGQWVMRWIIAADLLTVLYDDDEVWELTLSPLRLELKK
jgi:hypothetical protein